MTWAADHVLNIAMNRPEVMNAQVSAHRTTDTPARARCPRSRRRHGRLGGQPSLLLLLLPPLSVPTRRLATEL